MALGSSEVLGDVLKRNSAAGVFYVSKINDRIYEETSRLKVPFAIVNNASELFTSIVIDNEKGAYDAVKYLTSLGHKRIGIIKCKEDYYTFSERFNGYVKTMMEAGINLESQAMMI
ncbi:MAG: substrate-binding domain-containing protein [Clostridiales bacterium]|nr:substrate-binding domain-containing protein [Clostridiales bacterium]